MLTRVIPANETHAKQEDRQRKIQDLYTAFRAQVRLYSRECNIAFEKAR